MSEIPNKKSVSSTESKIEMKPNFGFLRSPPGIMMVVNIFLLFFAWVIMAGSKENELWPNISFVVSKVSFFLFTTITPWLILIVLSILFVFKIHTKVPVNWPITLCLNCAIWTFLLVISSILIAIETRKCKDSLYHGILYVNIGCNTIAAASVFGFFSSFGLAIQAFLNFREYDNPV